jgi:hypothetical protein
VNGYTLVLGRTVGRWQVTTMTAAYLIDFDTRTVTRTPGSGNVPFTTADLRRDTDVIPLLDMAPITVGQPMRLLLDVTADAETVTVRQSTPVVNIHPLPVTASLT